MVLQVQYEVDRLTHGPQVFAGMCALLGVQFRADFGEDCAPMPAGAAAAASSNPRKGNGWGGEGEGDQAKGTTRRGYRGSAPECGGNDVGVLGVGVGVGARRAVRSCLGCLDWRQVSPVCYLIAPLSGHTHALSVPHFFWSSFPDPRAPQVSSRRTRVLVHHNGAHRPRLKQHAWNRSLFPLLASCKLQPRHSPAIFSTPYTPSPFNLVSSSLPPTCSPSRGEDPPSTSSPAPAPARAAAPGKKCASSTPSFTGSGRLPDALALAQDREKQKKQAGIIISWKPGLLPRRPRPLRTAAATGKRKCASDTPFSLVLSSWRPCSLSGSEEEETSGNPGRPCLSLPSSGKLLRLVVHDIAFPFTVHALSCAVCWNAMKPRTWTEGSSSFTAITKCADRAPSLHLEFHSRLSNFSGEQHLLFHSLVGSVELHAERADPTELRASRVPFSRPVPPTVTTPTIRSPKCSWDNVPI